MIPPPRIRIGEGGIVTKKEFAEDLLSLLHEGKKDAAERLCEVIHFCYNEAVNDRAFNRPPFGYSKKEGDIVVENGELAKEVLGHLQGGDILAAQSVLRECAT